MSIVKRDWLLRALAVGALALGIGAYVSFGMLGVGRPNDRGSDLNVLVVAGETWNVGRSAYLDGERAATAGTSLAEQQTYPFAYLPNVHPVAAVFGVLGMPGAIYLSLLINTLALAYLTIATLQMAARDDPATLPSVERKLLLAAAVLVMPFVAHVSWMGQTSLIGIAAAVAAWRCARAGSAVWAALWLVVAAIKPQILLLIWVGMVFTLPWRSSLLAAVLGLAACVYPAIQAGGVVALLDQWLSAAAAYRLSPLNTPGFQHQTGVESLLAAVGVQTSGSVFVLVAVALMAAACWFLRPRDTRVLSLACCLAVILLPLHDYDLVVLAVPILVLGVSLSRPAALLALLATVAMLYLPQRFLRGDVAVWLLHYRTLLPIIFLVLLASQTKASRSSAGPGESRQGAALGG